MNEERSQIALGSELAVRVATYVRGSFPLNGPTISEVESDGRQAWFELHARDGARVRVTVEDTTLEAVERD